MTLHQKSEMFAGFSKQQLISFQLKTTVNWKLHIANQRILGFADFKKTKPNI